MKEIVLLLPIICLLIFCNNNSMKKPLMEDVTFTVSELGKDDSLLLNTLSCRPYNQGIVDKFKKVMINNCLYDTLYVPVYDCLRKTKSPFINYDVLEYYELDSTKTIGVIFNPAGYYFTIAKHNKANIFIHIPDKRKRHKFSVQVKLDSMGIHGFRDFSFLE